MIHPKAAARVRADLARIKRDAPQYLDEALEQYHDILVRATNWDADQWGFDIDRWMARERQRLLVRAEKDAQGNPCLWPKEPAAWERFYYGWWKDFRREHYA